MDGEWTALTGAWTEANKELERRVGMSPEQFGQVVMLPQGEFATFLKADARERRFLLERLFPTQDFSQVETWFKKRADDDRKRRDEKLREIEDRIEAVKPVVNNAREDEIEGLEDSPDPGEAGPLLKWIEATGKVLSGVAAAADSQRKAAVEKSEARDKELNLLKKQAELVAQRGQAEDRLEKLSGNGARRKQVGEEIQQADSAAVVAPLAETAARNSATLEETQSRHGTLREELLKRDEIDTAEADDLGRVSKVNSKLLAEISAFEEESLPRRRQLSKEVEELDREKDELEATGPKTELGIAEAELDEAIEDRRAARQSYIEARQHRTQGMAAELAGELKTGEPCAVCGSTEHPTPASPTGTVVSQEDEDAAAEADTAAEARESNAKQACQAIAAQLKERLAEIGTASKAAKAELKKLEDLEGKLTGNSASLTERRELVQGLVEQIDGFQELERSWLRTGPPPHRPKRMPGMRRRRTGSTQSTLRSKQRSRRKLSPH
ncbi:MAG: hypothetical protein IPK93_03650 [Solirubrobacterales bacterium]|nr:hypothetical protein [Solirubrobacterales bacterium]